MSGIVLCERHRELARHALGLPNEKRVSYRNRFVTDSGSDDHSSWDAMVEIGAARVRRNVGWMGGMDAFWLTRAGAEAALRRGESLDPEDFPEGKVGAAP